jgi:hypothetical protein
MFRKATTVQGSTQVVVKLDTMQTPAPDLDLFVSDLQESYFLFLFEGTFTSFFKDKSHNEVTKQINQGFSYYFC